jgi:hypothetical protein
MDDELLDRLREFLGARLRRQGMIYVMNYIIRHTMTACRINDDMLA